MFQPCVRLLLRFVLAQDAPARACRGKSSNDWGRLRAGRVRLSPIRGYVATRLQPKSAHQTGTRFPALEWAWARALMLAGEFACELLLAAAPPARAISPTETTHRSVRKHHLARQAAGVDFDEP